MTGSVLRPCSRVTQVCLCLVRQRRSAGSCVSHSGRRRAGFPTATGTRHLSSPEPELPLPRAELRPGVSVRRHSAYLQGQVSPCTAVWREEDPPTKPASSTPRRGEPPRPGPRGTRPQKEAPSSDTGRQTCASARRPTWPLSAPGARMCHSDPFPRSFSPMKHQGLPLATGLTPAGPQLMQMGPTRRPVPGVRPPAATTASPSATCTEQRPGLCLVGEVGLPSRSRQTDAGPRKADSRQGDAGARYGGTAACWSWTPRDRRPGLPVHVACARLKDGARTQGQPPGQT